MPLIRKRSPKLRFQFIPARQQSVLGGLPALETLAQQFDLWSKLRALPGLDPRTRTGVAKDSGGLGALRKSLAVYPPQQ